MRGTPPHHHHTTTTPPHHHTTETSVPRAQAHTAPGEACGLPNQAGHHHTITITPSKQVSRVPRLIPPLGKPAASLTKRVTPSHHHHHTIEIKLSELYHQGGMRIKLSELYHQGGMRIKLSELYHQGGMRIKIIGFKGFWGVIQWPGSHS